MLGHRTILKRGYKLGAATALAFVLAPGPWNVAVHAGTLAQLHLQAHAARLSPLVAARFEAARAGTSHMDLCVSVARTPGCRAALETALRSATQVSLARSKLYGAIAQDRSANAPNVIDTHEIALKFNEDPEWKRRAKVLAHDGLPFMRMPEGGNRELIVGITPHGRLGFSLKDTTGE